MSVKYNIILVKEYIVFLDLIGYIALISRNKDFSWLFVLKWFQSECKIRITTQF